MSMDVDLSEIFEVFFEESAEGLEIMETGLLGLDLGAADPEIVNDIFRAAHSIKGGASTFGFTGISSFTHGVETILDQMRDGTRDVTEEAVQLLLESVDCLAVMMQLLKAEDKNDPPQRASLDQRIEALLKTDSGSAANASSENSDNGDSNTSNGTESEAHPQKWKIEFIPGAEILHTGNDPLYIFKELEALGELVVHCDESRLPAFHLLDPEEIYISWALELTANTTSEAIADLFEWIADQGELNITCEEGVAAAENTNTESSIEAGNSISPAAPAAKDKNSPAKKPKKAANTETSSIRVGIDKVDSLLNLVGELVITQSMLRRFGENYNPNDLDELRDGLNQLERHTRELQESAMQIRMLPINSSFSRFPRLVRDLSTSLGKKINLELSGEHTEVDKTVLEKLSDPLVHLVRNSLDHGIEMPDVRQANGKSETGTLRLSAAHEGGNVIIKVEDDGAGLNRERIIEKATQKGLIAPGESLTDDRVDNLIFHPGFSTAETVTNVSGRGVGMDVVRRNIFDLGGRISVQSRPGKGTTLRISLPLTLAILDGQLVRINKEVYVIALLSIVETVQIQAKEIKTVSGSGEVFLMRDRYIPVVRAADVFGVEKESDHVADLLVIVESENFRFGILIDELLEQQQIVIKSIEKNYKKVSGLTGATILGDGQVALILDIPGLMQNLLNNKSLTMDGRKEPIAA